MDDELSKREIGEILGAKDKNRFLLFNEAAMTGQEMEELLKALQPPTLALNEGKFTNQELVQRITYAMTILNAIATRRRIELEN